LFGAAYGSLEAFKERRFAHVSSLVHRLKRVLKSRWWLLAWGFFFLLGVISLLFWTYQVVFHPTSFKTLHRIQALEGPLRLKPLDAKDPPSLSIYRHLEGGEGEKETTLLEEPQESIEKAKESVFCDEEQKAEQTASAHAPMTLKAAPLEKKEDLRVRAAYPVSREENAAARVSAPRVPTQNVSKGGGVKQGSRLRRTSDIKQAIAQKRGMGGALKIKRNRSLQKKRDKKIIASVENLLDRLEKTR